MDLTFSDWQAVVAVAVSVLGLVATLYTAFGSTARRLRSDLANDVKLVAELDGDVKDDLQESVTDRSYRLVAATRYPILTWYEVGLAFFLTPLFWLLYGAPSEIRALAERAEVAPELTGPGQLMVLAIALVTYSAASRSWARRAAARVVYVYRRLGDDEARSLVRLLAFPANLIPLAFAAALAIGVLLNASAITEAIAWPLWAAVLITMAISMLLLWSIHRIATRENLYEQLRFYTDVLHIGADIPRLRPAELGQTEEDLAPYEKAIVAGSQEDAVPANDHARIGTQLRPGKRSLSGR